MEMVKLHELCKMQSGGTPSRGKSEFYNGGTIPWSKISDLEKSNDGNIYETEEYITAEGLKSINNRLFKKGTLLLAMYGSVGKTAIAEIDLSTNQAILGINIKDESKLDIKYLRFWFTTIKNRLLNRAVGAALQNISLGIVKELEIPLPDLLTQQKIATILDKANALRQYNKQLIEKYDTLTQSLFLDMFGDPVRNEKYWKTKTIEELTKKEKGSIKRGPFGGALKKEIFVEEGYLVYEQFHALNNDFSMARYFINEEKFNELKGFEVKPGDIIISCSGVYLGKLAVIPKNAKKGIINQALLKVALDETIMRNDFFIFHFTHKNFREKYFDANRGAGIPNFPPMSDFKKFPFISPSIELQNQFAERVQLIETQKQQAQEALGKSEALFQSLLQRAFKGELN
ncbi:restriction endonuclease subunit S [Flavobacterium sp. GCM10023249]|uniref:restriction endonuclease subunit S n=1 Tax=unclassified Flavobacterium TaxID=196869 RepID=UPI0036087711